jgi:chemotaxis signal transduction protein
VSTLYVRVRVGDEHHALPVADVVEVAEFGEVTAVPGAGAAIRGVQNLRGQVLPVVELARALGLDGDGELRRIVIVERGGRKAGLAVGSVESVEALPQAAEEVDSTHVAGAALVEGALVGVVDVGSLLDALEGASAS